MRRLRLVLFRLYLTGVSFGVGVLSVFFLALLPMGVGSVLFCSSS